MLPIAAILAASKKKQYRNETMNHVSSSLQTIKPTKTHRTLSILLRLPVVLAVTAASYGLALSHGQAGASSDTKSRSSSQQAQAKTPGQRVG